MNFIEMSGATLLTLLHPDEYTPEELAREGITPDARVRLNREGDIELYRNGQWDVVGGLIGDVSQRIEAKTGLRWTDG